MEIKKTDPCELFAGNLEGCFCAIEVPKDEVVEQVISAYDVLKADSSQALSVDQERAGLSVLWLAAEQAKRANAHVSDRDLELVIDEALMWARKQLPTHK